MFVYKTHVNYIYSHNFNNSLKISSCTLVFLDIFRSVQNYIENFLRIFVEYYRLVKLIYKITLFLLFIKVF